MSCTVRYLSEFDHFILSADSIALVSDCANAQAGLGLHCPLKSTGRFFAYLGTYKHPPGIVLSSTQARKPAKKTGLARNIRIMLFAVPFPGEKMLDNQWLFSWPETIGQLGYFF